MTKHKVHKRIVGEVNEQNNEYLAQMRLRHRQRLQKAIRQLETKMIDLARRIKVDESGRVENLKVNLKQIQSVQKRMASLFEEDYGATYKSTVGDFNKVSKLIQNSWSELNEAAEFTSIDRTTIETLKRQTLAEYAKFGSEAQKQVADAMYQTAIGAAPFNQLEKTIRGILRQHKDVRGRSMATRSRQFAFDSVMNFHNQVNLTKAEGLDINHYLYVGNIIATSRDFCRARAGKVYTRDEIDSWNDIPWAGKAGPPFIYRGGYNCRHHWRPVRPEWIESQAETDPSLQAPPSATKQEQSELDEIKTDFRSQENILESARQTRMQLRGRMMSLKENMLQSTGSAKNEFSNALAAVQRQLAEQNKIFFAAEDRLKQLARQASKITGKDVLIYKPNIAPELPTTKVVSKAKPTPRPSKPSVNYRQASVAEPIRPTQPLKIDRRATGGSEDLRNRWKASQKDIDSFVDREFTTASLERREQLINDWQLVGDAPVFYNPGEPMYRLYEMHQKAFNARMDWYNSLSFVDKARERKRVVNSLLDDAARNDLSVPSFVENGTAHLSYRTLSELERGGLKIRYVDAVGRPTWDDLTNEITLYRKQGGRTISSARNSSVVAHEVGHAVDSYMSTNFVGSGQSGLVWRDGTAWGRFRDKLRAEFKRIDNQGTGRYINGDGNYYLGNWLNSYEARIYRKLTPYKVSITEDEYLQSIAEEWWSVNSTRFNNAFRRSRDNYIARFGGIGDENKMVDWIEKDIVSDREWRQVRLFYPELAGFMENFYLRMMIT